VMSVTFANDSPRAFRFSRNAGNTGDAGGG
jgi:hypothetical protein